MMAARSPSEIAIDMDAVERAITDVRNGLGAAVARRRVSEAAGLLAQLEELDEQYLQLWESFRKACNRLHDRSVEKAPELWVPTLPDSSLR